MSTGQDVAQVAQEVIDGLAALAALEPAVEDLIKAAQGAGNALAARVADKLPAKSESRAAEEQLEATKPG